jgi:hypothetical protein
MRSADSEDAAAMLIERRWFASIAAARSLRSECDTLRQVMEHAEEAWRCARRDLVRLEALCETLADELANRDSISGNSEGALHHPTKIARSAVA